ncbi:MAG: MFS transporter [Pauljensenia sp.]
MDVDAPATPTAADAMASDASATRAERLDRLPFTRRHARLLVGSGVGWALDAMDVGLISFVMVAVAAHWDLASSTTGWIASVGFIGMAIGATLGGAVADRIGRRQVFALTLVLYGVATGISALSVSVAMFMVLRFLVGLGLGAELPVASTLVSEYAPRRIRGRMVVWLEAFWAVGWLLAALIGAFVVPASTAGWRWALAIGMVPAVYAIIVRLHLPESVRFLESKGRHSEAEASVREFEAAAGVGAPQPGVAPVHPAPGRSTPGVDEGGSAALPGPQAQHRAEDLTEVRDQGQRQDRTRGRTRTADVGSASIWSPELRRRTAALWTIWFCINLSYYGAFVWIPSLLVEQGFTMVKSFQFTLVITLAQLPGYAAAAWLIEKWGRRLTLGVFLVGSAVAAALYGLASTGSTIIAAGMLLSFFNLGAWGALYAIGPELYPTSVRGTGTGAAAGFGRLASIGAPLLVPVLLGAGGNHLVFGVFAVAFAVAAVGAFTLPELKGQRLRD